MTERRSVALQSMVDELQRSAGISDEFAAASDHPHSCRCGICLDWWIQMGPEDPDNPSYGPFTVQEIEARKREMNREEGEV